MVIENPKSLGFFLDLDRGEAEAIVLASEMEADLLLLDEKLARFHAKHIGIPVSGTVGVLLKAKHAGYITALKPLLYELRSQGIWLSDDFISQMIELAGE
jgi:predicted nucleic acid-binding protein